MEMLRFALTITNTKGEDEIVVWASSPDELQKWVGEKQVGGKLWAASLLEIGNAEVVLNFSKVLGNEPTKPARPEANTPRVIKEDTIPKPEPKSSPVRKGTTKKPRVSRGSRKS